MSLTAHQRELRESFVDACGYWNESFEELLRVDEAFFRAYLELVTVPARRTALGARLRELVHVAIDGAATHLFAPGLREHIRAALAAGATREEVMEVLELCATLGIHACNIGVPILIEELAERGVVVDVALSEEKAALKAAFEEKRGYWNSFWDGMLALDEEFFAAYTHFSSVPWVSGVLSAKEKEFIYTAFDVAATHLYAPGLRQHVANALAYGATTAELMEVFEIASTLGIHACNLGVPILLEEAGRQRGGPT